VPRWTNSWRSAAQVASVSSPWKLRLYRPQTSSTICASLESGQEAARSYADISTAASIPSTSTYEFAAIVSKCGRRCVT